MALAPVAGRTNLPVPLDPATSPGETGGMRSFLSGPRPLLFAHRGGAALWPENTLLAFTEALNLGVSYLETDVHATRDGVLVVHHDDSVDRTTNGRGRIRDRSFEELRRLDAGYRHTTDGGITFPFRGRGLVIPSLAEVFELSAEARINIELKQHRPSTIAPFIELVERHRMHERVLVAAANDRTVREFRKAAAGRIATSAGEQEATLFWLAVRTGVSRWLPTPYDALQVPVISGKLTVVTRRFVAAAHAKNLQVHVWTIDELAEMRRLLALGVDGLMSDRPDRFGQLQGVPGGDTGRGDLEEAASSPF